MFVLYLGMLCSTPKNLSQRMMIPTYYAFATPFNLQKQSFCISLFLQVFLYYQVLLQQLESCSFILFINAVLE